MDLKLFSAETHQGPYLNINEDGCDYDFSNNIYMILDGFGGSGVGDKVVREIKDNIKKFYTQIASDINATMPFFYSPKYLIEGNALINSLIFSHKSLLAQNIDLEITKRGGASLLVAVKTENLFIFVSVGNCVVYLMRNGKLEKLFIEDSYHFLSSDSYDFHLKTAPMSGLGLYPELVYQLKEVRVQPDDKFIMMTDGAYARLNEEELAKIMKNDELQSNKKIAEIFKLVNSRGNLDNQTTMILEY
jgi:serine/threonine protein phosphatase PrpC